jgi:hypothetical protein
MPALVTHPKILPLLGPAIGLAAVLGWGSFLCSDLDWREQVSGLKSERDAMIAKYQIHKEITGELEQIEKRIALARIEYDRTALALAEARAKSGAVQQELAALTSRLDQTKDRVSQTGGIRSAEPPRRPAQKP